MRAIGKATFYHTRRYSRQKAKRPGYLIGNRALARLGAITYLLART